jgi:hypothetical protein
VAAYTIVMSPQALEAFTVAAMTPKARKASLPLE